MGCENLGLYVLQVVMEFYSILFFISYSYDACPVFFIAFSPFYLILLFFAT
jgi:hypothetical protein